ncbi:histidinol-phosphatase HisJ family protein [Virgibacillus dakarensis]|nr:histidinol-phosphatase HisJ family protein [Virgibacillus dakarensis]
MSHHHTSNSFDSKAEMEDICERAIDKGIEEICFTDHFSVNPKLPTYGFMDFNRYFREIEACCKKYNGRLTIRTGIELCEPHLMMNKYEEALGGKQFDFILGSVHNIDEEKLRLFMVNKDPYEIYSRYFEEVYELVSKSDIDVIAHLDLMKRYAKTPIGNYRFSDFQPIIKRILLKAIERGIGIEINTSGLANPKVEETFPTIEVVKLYKELGGEIITIGSDSHRGETVGSHVKDALQIAKEADFKYVNTFENRRAKMMKIEN